MMKGVIIIVAVMAVLLLSGCSAPTVTPAPTAVPTPAPTAQPTVAPTIAPTSVPGMDNKHAYYGTVMWEKFFPTSNTRSGMWGGVQINDAVGEVYILTSLNNAPLMGYIRSNNEFRIDNVPTGCDVKLQKVVLYMDDGGIRSIYATSEWMTFRDVPGNLRTPMAISI